MYEYKVVQFFHNNSIALGSDDRAGAEATLNYMAEGGWEFMNSSVVEYSQFMYFRRLKDEPELRLEKAALINFPQEMVSIQN